MDKLPVSEQAYQNGYSAGYKAGRRSVMGEPKHGRWIRKRYDDVCGGWWNEWTCSRCDWKIRENPKEFNYCPNCGAKMDLED
jgi:hypothetical protein